MHFDTNESEDGISTKPSAESELHGSISLINNVCLFINSNYMNDITLEKVAVKAGFSKYYLSKLFTDAIRKIIKSCCGNYYYRSSICGYIF